MSENAEDQRSTELGFERLVFFSDAVLAIAITLMALEIRVPEMEPEVAAAQISAAFNSLLPHIFVYVLSFLVVGMYWMVHHRLFRAIRRYDARLIWLNLIFLMIIAFLPVATNALGNYPDLPLVVAFYAVSVALVGIAEFVLWLYATRKRYLVSVDAARANVYFGLRMLTAPAVFLLSLLLLPLGADLTKYSWAMIVPILFGLRYLFPEAHAERQRLDTGAH